MVSALITVLSSPGSSPGRGHCVGLCCVLGQDTCTGEFNAGGNPVMIQWGVEIRLVA